MDIDGVEKYDVHVITLRNTKIGEPEIKNTGEKLQDNNEFILHKNIEMQDETKLLI